jgi:hypothetical protein
MLTINELETAFDRFRDQTHFYSCYPKFHRFVGFDGTEIISNEITENLLTVEQERRIRLLLGPHYRTIIRAWLLLNKYELPETASK